MYARAARLLALDDLTFGAKIAALGMLRGHHVGTAMEVFRHWHEHTDGAAATRRMYLARKGSSSGATA
jgi:hypothetical protein